MKRINMIVATWTFCGLCGLVNAARAEIPIISFLITASEETPYGRVVPIASFLRSREVKDIDFAVSESPGIAVAIRIRSDVPILDPAEIVRLNRAGKLEGKIIFNSAQLDDWSRQLKDAGAARVTTEKVPVLKAAPFTIETFEKLRGQEKPIIVVCRADWSVPSQRMDRDVFENAEVIRKVEESNALVLVLDITERPTEEEQAFIDKYKAYVFCVLVFEPIATCRGRLIAKWPRARTLTCCRRQIRRKSLENCVVLVREALRGFVVAPP